MTKDDVFSPVLTASSSFCAQKTGCFVRAAPLGVAEPLMSSGKCWFPSVSYERNLTAERPLFPYDRFTRAGTAARALLYCTRRETYCIVNVCPWLYALCEKIDSDKIKKD